MASQTKAESWANLLAAHAASGLTKKAFCAEHGLNAATFYSWQRKLRAQTDHGSPSESFVQLTARPVHELTICLPQGEVALRSESTATLAELIIALAHA